MERLVVLLLLVVLGYGIATHNRNPAPSLAGTVAIPRHDTDTYFWRGDADAEDRIRVRDRSGRYPPQLFDVDERGVLHQTPGQASGGPLEVDYIHNRYLGRTWVDIGAWGGVVGTSSGDPPLQLGLRLSPARFFDGVLAPDLAFSDRAVGVGASVYPPRELALAAPWGHLGLGVWYMAAYNGHGAGPALGLALSIR